jgi:hypothetical protein
MSANNLVLANMYNMGYISNNINENPNIPNIFECLNKDIYIEMIRKNVTLWGNETESQYNCVLTFKNNLGNILFELNMSEIDIIKFLDCSTSYFAFGMKDICISIPINKPNQFGYYLLTWQKYIQDYPYIEYDHFIITEYNSQLQISVKRLDINFGDTSESLKMEEFLDMLYMTFIVDIENIHKDDLLYFEETFYGYD